MKRLCAIFIFLFGLCGIVAYSTNFFVHKEKPNASKASTFHHARVENHFSSSKILPLKASSLSFRKSFNSFLSNTIENLPTRRDVLLGSEDMHHAPVALIEAGFALGKIVEVLEKEPELADEALSFYRDCALRSEILISIRALCYSNLEKWNAKLGMGFEDEINLVPEKIRLLASDLKSF